MTVVIGQLATTPTLKTPGFYDPNQVPSGTEAQKELGRVEAILELNGVLYVGGDYSHVVDNSGSVPVDTAVSFISAWRTDTWALISTWNVSMPGHVRWIAATPDGLDILIGGDTSPYFKVYAALTGPTDVSAPVGRTYPAVVGGNVEYIQATSNTVAYLVGGFTSVGGHATVNAAKIGKSGTTWSVTAAFSCPGVGGTANVKIGAVKPDDASIVLVGGDFSGAVLAFDGTTGLSAAWGFNFTTGEGEGANQSCIGMAFDANMVAASGDFGQNIVIVTDWTGSGPHAFTNITGGWNGYWSHTTDGNCQAVAVGQLNGEPVLYIGHHGTVAATQINTATVATSPASTGFLTVPWTTTGGDRIAYGDPPAFQNPSNTSTPLKVWGIFQSFQSGTLHVGGDYTAVSGGALNSSRRYSNYTAPITGGGGGGGGGSGTASVSVVQEVQKKLTTAASSFTISLPAPATPGNALLLAVSSNTVARRGGSVSDDASNTWAALKESGVTNASNDLVWWAQGVTGGQIVTFPWSSGTAQAVAILQELSGIDPTAALPGTALAQDFTTAAGSFVSPTLTSSAPCYLVSSIGFKANTGAPFTSSAGWNESLLEGAQAGTSLGLAGEVQQAGGTFTNTFTANGGTGGASVVIAALPVTLTDSGGGGATPGVYRIPVPPAFTPSRTVTCNTPTDFANAITGLTAGDYVAVNAMTIPGEIGISNVMSDYAEIHFASGVQFTGGSPGDQFPAVWINGASKVRLYGGEISHSGGTGILIYDSTNVLWYGFVVHNCDAHGLLIANIATGSSGLDLDGEIYDCGHDLTQDPHVEKGTGLHGAYIGSNPSGGNVDSSQFSLHVHDQPHGGAVQVGSHCTNSTFWVKAERITFAAQSQTAGNAMQLFGNNLVNLTIPYLRGQDLQGRVFETSGMKDGPPDPGADQHIHVEYAEASNVLLNPVALLQGSAFEDGPVTAASVDNKASLGSSGTHAYTCNAVSGYLIVQVDLVGNTIHSTGVTYAGVAMSLLARESTVNTIEFWGLKAPATGANNVITTLSGADPGSAVGATSFTGVDQTTPVGSASGTHGSSTTALGSTITATPNDLILSGVNAAHAVTIVAPAVQQWNNAAGHAAATLSQTAGSGAVSWTQSTGNWATMSVAVKGIGATVIYDQTVVDNQTTTTKPVFGVNSGPTGNNVWTPVNNAIGGNIKGYRSYGTPAQNIPATYPGTGNPPSGVTLRVSSLKPDIPTFINGTTLDAQWSAWCAKAPSGDMVTLWHEGESNDGWTSAQIIALHKKAYALAKAANPNVLYGQIFTSASAFSGNFGFPIQNWVATRTDGGPLDYYGIDAYGPNPAQHTILGAIQASVTGIQAVVPNAKFGIFESNAISTHVAGTSDTARAQEYAAAYNYCVANNFLTFFPFFFPQGSVNTFNYDWDPGDTATIAELSRELTDSLTSGGGGGGGGGGGPNSYIIPSDGSLDGMYLSVLETATGTDSSGTPVAVTVRSNVVGPIAAASTGNPPANTTPPNSGVTQVNAGTTVNWLQGVWTNSPTSLADQVQRRPSGGADSTITDISGQTSASYTTLPADVGFDVRLKETATNSHGSATAFSTWTTVTFPVVTPPVTPTITFVSPAGDITITGDAGTLYTVIVEASSDSAIQTVFINGNLASVDVAGNYFWQIALSLGSNVVIVTATDADGDSTTNAQTITLDQQSGGGGGGGGGGTGGTGSGSVDISPDQERIAEEIDRRGMD